MLTSASRPRADSRGRVIPVVIEPQRNRDWPNGKRRATHLQRFRLVEIIQRDAQHVASVSLGTTAGRAFVRTAASGRLPAMPMLRGTALGTDGGVFARVEFGLAVRTKSAGFAQSSKASCWCRHGEEVRGHEDPNKEKTTSNTV